MKKNPLFIMSILLFATILIYADGTALNDNNFYKVTKGKVYIIDFYADWCGPCVAFAPAFDSVSRKMTNGNFAKVDVDNAPGLSKDFKIQYIPFIAAVKDGKFIEEYTGDRSESDFYSWCSRFFEQMDNGDKNLAPIKSTFTEPFGGGKGIRYKIRNVSIEDGRNILESPKGGTFHVSMDILHDCPEAGNAVNQIIVGLAGEDIAQVSVWNGKNRSGGGVKMVNKNTNVEAYCEDNPGDAEWVTVYFKIQVPDKKGIYYLRTRYSQAYTGNLRTKEGLKFNQTDFKEPLNWWKVDRPDGPDSTANIGAFIIK